MKNYLRNDVDGYAAATVDNKTGNIHICVVENYDECDSNFYLAIKSGSKVTECTLEEWSSLPPLYIGSVIFDKIEYECTFDMAKSIRDMFFSRLGISNPF